VRPARLQLPMCVAKPSLESAVDRPGRRQLRLPWSRPACCGCARKGGGGGRRDGWSSSPLPRDVGRLHI
jgi:hypothetical protein